jgi:hypothetical protein
MSALRSPLTGSQRAALAERAMPYGEAMLELDVALSAEQVLRECERRGLVIRRERGL